MVVINIRVFVHRIWLSSVLAMVFSACTTSPQPITDIEGRAASTQLQLDLEASQEPFSGELTLYEAMARALKYNLDHRVSMMEIDLARADYEVSRYKGLLNVVSNGGIYSRNNQQGSSSLSLISGRESLEPSTATDKTYGTGDLKTTWNILDFGLSKIRSEQLADEVLIYEERRRKAITQIIGDVHRSYWRALSAQRLNHRLLEVEEDVKKALEGSRALYNSRNTSPFAALSYQRDLKNIQIEAQSLLSDLSLAKVELAGLIGLSPHQFFTLKPAQFDETPKALAIDFEQMIDLSLRQRPEVREALYKARIGEKEIKKTVLETLPSLEAFAGLNVNSNGFLYHSNWVDYGARASWNIAKVFSLGKRKRKAKAEVKLEEQRGLAAATAVMTQVGIARALYLNSMAEYLTATESMRIQADILIQIDALVKAGSSSRQILIKERLNKLMSESRRDLLQAELKQAAAQIYASVGFDPYGADITGDEDVAIIAASLQAHWEARENTPKYEAETSAQAANSVPRNKYDEQT